MKKLKSKNALTLIFCLIFSIWLASLTSEQAVSEHQQIEKNLDKVLKGIAKVTDGDTIKIDDKRIRLIGIDAPETSQTCFDADYEEYSCGIMSKNFLLDMAQNREVECYYEKFDKYNRYLAECYVADKMINQEMIKNGMAVIYTFGPKDLEMTRLENEAQNKKLGIWQGAFQLPKDYRKMHPRK